MSSICPIWACTMFVMYEKASHYNVFQRPVVFSKPMSFPLRTVFDFCAHISLCHCNYESLFAFLLLFISLCVAFWKQLKSNHLIIVCRCENQNTQCEILSRGCFKRVWLYWTFLFDCVNTIAKECMLKTLAVIPKFIYVIVTYVLFQEK